MTSNQVIKANEIDQAVAQLRRGGVIAYPTEAVYGLGCDPFHVDAVTRILQLKHRPIAKGFILVASCWEQLEPFVAHIPPNMLSQVLDSWPGPHTWVFPAKPDVPRWLTGDHASIAVRVSAHQSVSLLCHKFGGAIISTSANVSQQPPARNARTVAMAFPTGIDYVLPGTVGAHPRPTEIRDALTGEILRAS